MGIPTIEEILSHCDSTQCPLELLVSVDKQEKERCPECGASPYSRCFDERGGVRPNLHLGRIFLAVQNAWPNVEVV
jgi:hypothetical protein